MTEVSLDLVTCPVCGREQPAVPHYPGYLCRECVARGTDEGGRRVVLGNTSETGGFAARYADDQSLAAEVTVTHFVYVDGNRCWADEARYGGVVVQLRPFEGE